ncbi:hypothetical protein BC829DRAFT_435122 [Chytridium lagenaria]|nr:hypothetical protein BC829DRAFT_435122 [Chytridium lagenaria]
MLGDNSNDDRHYQHHHDVEAENALHEDDGLPRVDTGNWPDSWADIMHSIHDQYLNPLHVNPKAFNDHLQSNDHYSTTNYLYTLISVQSPPPLPSHPILPHCQPSSSDIPYPVTLTALDFNVLPAPSTYSSSATSSLSSMPTFARPFVMSTSSKLDIPTVPPLVTKSIPACVLEENFKPGLYDTVHVQRFSETPYALGCFELPVVCNKQAEDDTEFPPWDKLVKPRMVIMVSVLPESKDFKQERRKLFDPPAGGTLIVKEPKYIKTINDFLNGLQVSSATFDNILEREFSSNEPPVKKYAQ